MTSTRTIAIALLASSFISAQDTWDDRTGALTGSNSSPSHSVYVAGRFFISGSSSTYWHSEAGTASWSPLS